MAILTLPASLIGPAEIEWGLRSNSQAFVSPLNRSAQTLENPGAVWVASLSWPTLTRDQRRDLAAMLVRLRGQAGRLYFGDPAARTPRGIATGAPVVAGAGQTGSVLAVSGAAPSLPNWLRAGDYIHFDTPDGRRELKMVTQDAATNAGGAASLQIEPPIRTSPAAGAAIATSNATCIMRPEDDEQAKWRVRQAFFGSVALRLVESPYG
jgi:hypothetical protein